MIPLDALLLYDGRVGHAEQPVDVDTHFHLHLGVVAIMLGTNILNSETPLETTEVALIGVPKCRERGKKTQMYSFKAVNLNSNFM